ncbi:MAG: hypothetical protein A2536_06360 [Candidatus Firestonebacteria bacterium RIFOXYD2_FULL_39_29]|nr:MAG: hypothetical protein A2536_06360 [Candidatus Firestonebacteria bacterium RIFOXYD2_FULL_39_29]
MKSKTVLLNKGEMKYVDNIDKTIKDNNGKGIGKGKVIRAIIKAVKSKELGNVAIKKAKNILTLLILTFLLTGIGFAEEKINVAVLSFESKNVSETDTSIFVSLFRHDLYRTNKYLVIGRDKMEDVLKEQKLQMTGCTSSECAVEVGKLLNVRKIFIGDINELGGIYYITVRLLDVESGSVDKSERIRCESKNDFEECSVKLASNITGVQLKYERMKTSQYLSETNKYSEIVKPSKPLDAWAWIAGGFAIATAGSYLNASNEYDLYQKAQSNESALDHKTKTQTWDTATLACGIGTGVFGLIALITNTSTESNVSELDNDKIHLVCKPSFDGISIALCGRF